jgi:predicted metal-binding membrane protein
MLMLVLLALGVMSVMWMAVVAVAIAVEKLAPTAAARFASRVVASALLVLCVVALIRPTWVANAAGMDEAPSMR